MSSQAPQSEQDDLTSSSSPSHIDHQPQLTHAPNHNHQFHQQTPNDLSSHLRPLQPQPYAPSPYNPPIYNPYLYPRLSQQHSQTSQHVQSSAGSSENDHDIKRMRISRACDGCRRKKIRCATEGEGKICKNCRLSNTVCTFKDSAKKRGPPKGYIEVLENRLKRMEKLLGGIVDDKESASTANGREAEIVVSPTEEATKSSPPQLAATSSSTSASCSSTNDHAPSTSAMAKHSSPDGTNSDPSIINDKAASKTVINKPGIKRERPRSNQSIAEVHPRYIGDMSTLPFLAQKFNFEDDRFTSPVGIKIRRFGQSLVMYEEGNSATDRTPNQLLLEKLGMLEPGEPIDSVDDWIYKVADITKPTSDRLMKIYFAYIHPGLPVVNKTLFLNQYRGLANDYPSAPLLNAMYGAATRYIETCKLFGDETAVTDAFDDDIDGWQIPDGGSERLFENLIKYVRGRYNPSIATIQALVIAQNHRASMDGKMTGGWLINAAAIRMAQDLGLHRSSEVWDISEDEQETRRRVWWAVYIMDKWSAASTGRPQTIFDEDCDESYPSESAPWEEVMDVATDINSDDHQPRFPSLDKSVAQKANRERIPIYQPFVQLVKLSEILGHILQGLYTPWAKKYSAEHGSDAIVSYLDKALSDWRAALPPTLQVSGTNFRKLDSRGRTPLLSMSGLMYLSYCTLLILLHRPFIEKEGGEKTKSSVSSLSICTSAATRCVDVAASMHFRDFLLVSWNFAIYHVFTASLIHIHTAANSGSIVSDVAKDDLIKAVRVVKRLSNLSTAACQIHQVLLRLMKMGNIPYTDDDEEDDPKQPVKKDSIKGKKPRKSTSVVAPSTPTSKSTSASTSSLIANINMDHDDLLGPDNIKSGVSSRISDVGRGQPPRKSTSSPSNDSQFTSNSMQQHDDRTSSASSTPTSVINGDWINGLYSSLQHDGNHTPRTSTNPQLESDPHSLRQFGMDMEQMFTPIDQMDTVNNASRAMALNQSQQFNLAAVGLTQNFLFGLSNIGFGTGGIQQQQQQPLESLYDNAPRPVLFAGSSSSSSSTPQNQTQQKEQQPVSSSQNTVANNYVFPVPMQSSLPNATVPSQLPMVDHSLFRNRPDNPFWSVPSSIEMDDWTAYLLPPQGGDNGNIGHQQQDPHLQPQQQQTQQPQQQQTWPSGWN